MWWPNPTTTNHWQWCAGGPLFVGAERRKERRVLDTYVLPNGDIVMAESEERAVALYRAVTEHVEKVWNEVSLVFAGYDVPYEWMNTKD